MVAGRNGGKSLNKLLKKALAEYQAGNFSAAQSLYQKVLRDDPGNLDANCLLGTLYAERGNLDVAFKYLQLAADIAPRFPMVQNSLGSAYRIKGDYEMALRCYQRALALNPGMAEAYHNIGTVYRSVRRLRDAAVYFHKAVSLNPRMVRAYNDLAHVLESLGEVEEAAASYRRVAELDPDDLSARHRLAALSGQNTDSAPPSFVLELFDAHADKFDHHLVEVLGYRIPRALRNALDALAGEGVRFHNAVDIGCGTGLSGKAFRDVAQRLSGIDLAPGMIAEAEKKNVYDSLQVGDAAEALGKSKEKYDLFIAADTFVYVGKLERIFQAVREHALEGALFAFSTEVSDAEDCALLRTGRYAHSERYIGELAEQHGFAVVSRKPTPLRKEREDWIVGNLFVLRCVR